MNFVQGADSWIGLFKIVWISLILSRDNVIVLALVAWALPAVTQQRRAISWTSGAAGVLRIALAIVAAKLLELSFLQAVGGLSLLWIGMQMLDAGQVFRWRAARQAHESDR